VALIRRLEVPPRLASRELIAHLATLLAPGELLVDPVALG